MATKNKVIIFLIVVTTLVVIGVGGYFIYNQVLISNNFNNKNKDKVEDYDDTRQYIISYIQDEEGSGRLVGINSKGEISTIVSYTKKGFKSFDLYENDLYYIYDNYLYKLDLSKEDSTPEKLFKVDVTWDITVGKDKVYISGEVNDANNPFQLFEYTISNGSKKLISKDIGNKVYFNKTTKQVFYTKRSDNNLYTYNTNENIETLIAEDSRIVYANDKKMYIASATREEGTVVNEVFYIYTVTSNEFKKSNFNLSLAFEYGDNVIYNDGTKVMWSPYEEKSEVLYDFRDLGDDVVNIIPLKDRLIVIVLENIGVGEYDLSYYMLNLTTKKMEKTTIDYSFLEDGVTREYIVR